jgi:uncharacterized protein (TIGR01244 family)
MRVSVPARLGVAGTWWLVAICAAMATFTVRGGDTIEAGELQTWGAETRVVQVDRFYIASQPDQAALETAGDAGVSIIINLRRPSESDWDEAGAAAALGLDYFQVPVDGSEPELPSTALDEVSQIVEANPDATILVHCSSGNRASAWFAVYLVQEAGMDEEQAISTANQTGLTSSSMEKKVRAYLEQ